MVTSSVKTGTETDNRRTGGDSDSPGKDRSVNPGLDSVGGQENFKVPRYSDRRKLSTVKIKQTDLILFTTQLSVMLDSGVVLSDALDAIAMQIERQNPVFAAVVTELTVGVKNGENFSKVLKDFPKIFNPMFISMVKASEASGRMSEMLNVLSGYLEFEMDTRKQIKGAMTYPFIMAIMAVAATGTLMFFVLPRFMRIYESRGADLPKLTQILVGVSGILGNFNAMTVIVTFIISAAILFRYWVGTSAGKRAIDFIKLHTPVIGTMFIDMVVTRSMRIMATMKNTGVSLLDSIEVIQGACDTYYFKRLWKQVDSRIRDGYQLSEAIQIAQGLEMPSLDKTDFAEKAGPELIDAGIVQMLRAGEKSGKLGQVSDKISTFYEKKLEGSIKSVMVMIEPIMITVLGIVIGTIAIALLLPVFKISTVVGH